jgi:hypothetical protein
VLPDGGDDTTRSFARLQPALTDQQNSTVPAPSIQPLAVETGEVPDIGGCKDPASRGCVLELEFVGLAAIPFTNCGRYGEP